MNDFRPRRSAGRLSLLYAEIFQWGLPIALWKDCCLANVIEETDKLCPKRDQGLSIGEYKEGSGILG